MKYEHTSAVLHFEKKDFALSRGDILQGLTTESAQTLTHLGNAGWELVAAMPYLAVSATLMRQTGTDAAVAFFKRPTAA